MNFTYRAKDLEGRNQSGQIESSDEHTAATILRRKGLIIIEVRAKHKAGNNIFSRFFNRVNFNEIVTLTRQLATMISAGLVLTEAIEILYEQETNKRLKKVFEDISDDIKGGLSLANALGRHRDVFSNLYINLIKAGETSGKLDEVLLKMADSLEKDREFRAKIKGAMIYPVVVLAMMLIVIFIMMIFVIPRLTSLYQESTLELPLPTRLLILISELFVNFWWIMLIVSAALIVSIKRWISTPSGKQGFDNLILKTPIIGKLIINVTLTNFNRTFGLLTSAGIPLLDSIKIVNDLTDNTIFKQALNSSYSGVEKGLTFSAQLIALPIFPRIIGQMVKVGEETGKVDEIFYKLADYFEQESDHFVKNLTVIIEPVVLVILGIGVAFLVISVILPIYKLTTSF